MVRARYRLLHHGGYGLRGNGLDPLPFLNPLSLREHFLTKEKDRFRSILARDIRSALS